jgi:hypothetical protein
MAFFNRLPNVEYDLKPLVFPFSEQEYALAKNFFRRYKLSDGSFNYTTLFKEYVMTDEDRPDILSNKFYQNSDYDWIILITNNIINTYFDLPVKEAYLYDMVNEAYATSSGSQTYPADRIHHYETYEIKNSSGKTVLRGGVKVEKSFYDSAFKYFNNGAILSLPGNQVSKPVTNYEYEKDLNDQKRKIYILRPEFVQEFISQYEEGMTYSRSNSYIDRKTKRSGI